jgi:cytochrome c oxidase assembly protein subunit 15
VHSLLCSVATARLGHLDNPSRISLLPVGLSRIAVSSRFVIGSSSSRRLAVGVGWLGLAAAGGMFLVLVAGATVTSTGSAQGCGHDWPLCRGRFIPEFAITTAIEFTHRAITGLEGVLVVALAAGLLKLYWSRVAARVLAVLLVGSVVLQAGMGAWAVMQPQQPLVLALHFGISLIAFAAAILAALSARWPDKVLIASPVAPMIRLATWGLATYLYALVYTGAYIRHAGAAFACPGWPLCGPAPGSLGQMAINLAHRGGAGLALLLALGLGVLFIRHAAGRRDLSTGAWVLTGLLAAQGLAGAYLVFSGWALYGELLHASVTALVFAAIAYLCFRVTLGTMVESGQETTRSRHGSESTAVSY